MLFPGYCRINTLSREKLNNYVTHKRKGSYFNQQNKKKYVVGNVGTGRLRTRGIVLYRTDLLRQYCTVYSQYSFADLPVPDAGDTWT
jgi:hypothetical protein